MIRKQLIVVIGVALFLASCNSNKGTDRQQKLKQVKYVKSAPVIEKEYALPVHAFGKLAAQKESKLSFKIGGIIQSIYVNQGQRVEKGQVLATLDKSEINAQVASAKANFEKWERDLKRMERLQEEKVVTLESYQNVKTQYDVAVSNLQIAEFNRKYSTIIAPIDGKVLKKFAEVNELTKPGTPIFLIGSTGSQVVIKAALTDKEVVNLQEGDSASVQFDALPGMDFVGNILLINNAPDARSGLYETEIILLKDHPGLRIGFFAKVQIYPSESNTYQFLPIEAIVEGSKKKGYIYAVKENRAVRIELDIHSIQDDQLIVRNDIGDVTEIITEGAQYLDPNDEIIVVNN